MKRLLRINYQSIKKVNDMKKIPITLLLLIFTLSTYSQECKIKIDKFTGEEIVSYGKKRGYYFEYSEGEIHFNITHFFAYTSPMKFIKKGAKISFRFQNGEIMDFYTANDVYPMRYVSSEASNIFLTYKLILSMQQLKQMATNKIEVMRIPTLEADYKDITWGHYFAPKYSVTLFNGAQCILSYIEKEKR